MLSDLKLAPAVRVLPQDATGVFKDSYLVDFLGLPETHSEADLQTGLLRNLRKFLLELGDGFAFVGEKVRVYDAFNRRVSVQTSAGSYEYVFDPSGNRLSTWAVSNNSGLRGEFI